MKTLLVILPCLLCATSLNAAPLETESENIDPDYEPEEVSEDETEIVFANEEKRLFKDYLDGQSKEERLESIKELKAKNREDQRRRRAQRRRRRKQKHNIHDGRTNRVNRNTKR